MTSHDQNEPGTNGHSAPDPLNQPLGLIDPNHNDPVILMAEQLLRTLETKIQERAPVAKIPADVPQFEMY